MKKPIYLNPKEMRVKLIGDRYYITCNALGMHFRIGPYEDDDKEYLQNRVNEILSYIKDDSV
jgi:hypothetical protein